MSNAGSRDRVLDLLAEAIADELWCRVIGEETRDRHGVETRNITRPKKAIAQ